MKKTALLLIALALVIPAAVAQEDPALRSLGVYNGRMWMQLDDSRKTYFLAGFFDGLQCCASTKDSAAFFPSARIGEVQTGLDEIFGKPENAAIPIFSALKVFVMKVNGSPLVEVDNELASLRRLYARLATAPAK